MISDDKAARGHGLDGGKPERFLMAECEHNRRVPENLCCGLLVGVANSYPRQVPPLWILSTKRCLDKSGMFWQLSRKTGYLELLRAWFKQLMVHQGRNDVEIMILENPAQEIPDGPA
jgi:hypothetical protein